MGFAESIRDCFDPALRISPALKIIPATVTFDDEDYREIEKLIVEESRLWGPEFDIVYDTGHCTLRIAGKVQFSYTDSGGDGFATPCETLEDYTIKVHIYECRDTDGELTAADFDPSLLGR